MDSIKKLAEEFAACRKVLVALGDENRQHLILEMMTIMDAMKQRHSVRQYLDRPIDVEVIEELRAEIEACSRERGLSIQLVADEPKAFSSLS